MVNTLGNLENLAYSRASGLITVETALDLDGPLGNPLMAEAQAYLGDARGMGRGAKWSDLVENLAGPDHLRVLPTMKTRSGNGDSPFCAHSEHD